MTEAQCNAAGGIVEIQNGVKVCRVDIPGEEPSYFPLATTPNGVESATTGLTVFGICIAVIVGYSLFKRR